MNEGPKHCKIHKHHNTKVLILLNKMVNSLAIKKIKKVVHTIQYNTIQYNKLRKLYVDPFINVK